MLSVGQFVTDVHTGKIVKIIGVQQVFGMTTYQVYDADTGDIYNSAERALRANSSLAEPSTAFVRFVSVYAKVKNELASGTVVDVSECYPAASSAVCSGAGTGNQCLPLYAG